MTGKPQKTVDFGFENIAEDKKTSRVGDVFDSVADRYDLMNDLMSAGLHRLWKNRMVNKLSLYDDMHILDVAGGTGDIAFRFLDKASEVSKDIDVTICDINSSMLEEGRKRAIDNNILHNIAWQEGNAEDLPFADNSFDAYTIAFGIRNVTHKDVALKEAYRVLKPGGKFMCLEFSHIEQPILNKLYDAYSFNIIPKIGKAITGDSDAYKYLVESICMFPDKGEFARMIGDAGFSKVDYDVLNHGIVAIHSGWKI